MWKVKGMGSSRATALLRCRGICRQGVQHNRFEEMGFVTSGTLSLLGAAYPIVAADLMSGALHPVPYPPRTLPSTGTSTLLHGFNHASHSAKVLPQQRRCVP